MNKRMIPIIMFLTMFINIEFCHGKVNFSPGIKTGITFTIPHYNQIDNHWIREKTHPAGLFFCIFSEIKLSNRISLMNELSYVNNKSGDIVTTVIGDLLENELRLNYLRSPCFLKFSPAGINTPYFLFGIDFGYLLKAEIRESSSSYSKKIVITNELPSVDISIDAGFGQKIKINKIYLVWETRGLLGLTKYERSSTYRKYEIQLIIGFQLIE